MCSLCVFYTVYAASATAITYIHTYVHTIRKVGKQYYTTSPSIVLLSHSCFYRRCTHIYIRSSWSSVSLTNTTTIAFASQCVYYADFVVVYNKIKMKKKRIHFVSLLSSLFVSHWIVIVVRHVSADNVFFVLDARKCERISTQRTHTNAMLSYVVAFNLYVNAIQATFLFRTHYRKREFFSMHWIK